MTLTATLIGSHVYVRQASALLSVSTSEGNRLKKQCAAYRSFFKGEFNKLLIVSGTIFSGVPHIPEFIDLASSTTVCNTPPLYPPKVSYDADAVGTFIGSKALVCGGRLGGGFKNWKTHRECYFFDGCNGGWSRGPDLPDERYGARGVMLDDKRWWIVGGKQTG